MKMGELRRFFNEASCRVAIKDDMKSFDRFSLKLDGGLKTCLSTNHPFSSSVKSHSKK